MDISIRKEDDFVPSTIVTLALWAPFLIVILITGLIFAIRGYKTGLWKALISLAATLVAAGLSFLLATTIGKFLAPIASAKLIAVLPLGKVPASLVEMIAGGLIKMVLSLTLFAPCFVVITPIVKKIASCFGKEALKTERKGLKWGGLGIRLVDAVLYTALLFLPLYGTLAAYMPSIKLVYSYLPQDGALSIFGELLGSVESHPVVNVAGSGAMQSIYENLGKLEVGDSTVSVEEVVNTVGQVSEKLKDVKNPKDLLSGEKGKELISYIKEEVADKPWVQEVCAEVISEVAEDLVKDLPVSNQQKQQIVSVLDVDKDGAAENLQATLEFMEFAVEKDLLNKFEDNKDNTTQLAKELEKTGALEELGALLNATDELSQVKKILMQPEVEGNASVVNKVKQAVSQPVSGEASQKKEVEAMILMTISPVDALLRHPQVSQDLAKEYFDSLPFESLNTNKDADTLTEAEKEQIRQDLWNKALADAKKPWTQVTQKSKP